MRVGHLAELAHGEKSVVLMQGVLLYVEILYLVVQQQKITRVTYVCVLGSVLCVSDMAMIKPPGGREKVLFAIRISLAIKISKYYCH